MIWPHSLDSEITFSASRSSGAGGQNVNKVNTQVELRFDVMASAILTDEQKKLIIDRLRNRMNLAGELIVVCSEDRSQWRNREKANEKLYYLLNKAIEVEKPRKATRPTKASKTKRLESKKHT